MKKRLFAIALVLMLALTLLPVTAFAEGEGGISQRTIEAGCASCKKELLVFFWSIS